MSDTKTEFKAGDVVRYETLTMPSRHCREGWAIARTRDDDSVYLLDTFWGSGDTHVLTDEEIATAELMFNLADYDELDRYRSHESRAKWETYRPADRETVTSQHGLQVRWFIRKGAQPDLATQIDNARQGVADAYEKLRSADFGVELAWAELKRLESGQ